MPAEAAVARLGGRPARKGRSKVSSRMKWTRWGPVRAGDIWAWPVGGPTRSHTWLAVVVAQAGGLTDEAKQGCDLEPDS